jgi:hypothetical protein
LFCSAADHCGGQLELVAVPEDAGLASVLVGLDVDALLDLPPRRLGKRRGVEAVVLAEDGADGPGGLRGVVVRDGGEEVVRDVRIGDVVEEGPAEHAVVAVDGGERAAEPVPLGAAVVRQRRVGVVEVRDEHQPRVHHQQRRAVDARQPPGPLAARHRDAAEREGGRQEAGVGERDAGALPAAGEDGRAGVEVGGPARVRAAPGVEHQVHGPPHGELHGEQRQPRARVVVAAVHALGVPRQVGLPAGHVDLVAVEGARVGVVAEVAVLPGEVGRQQRRVEEQAQRVVEARVLGEGTVPALVRDHPDAEQHAALQHPVERPGGEAERGRERRDARQREPQEAPGDGEVAEEVGGGPEERAPEAVRRHGAPDLCQREGRLVRRGPRQHGRRRSGLRFFPVVSRCFSAAILLFARAAGCVCC